MSSPLGEMTYYELIKELQRLNPTAEIKVDEISYDDILSTVPVEKLVLPKVFILMRKMALQISTIAKLEYIYLIMSN